MPAAAASRFMSGRESLELTTDFFALFALPRRFRLAAAQLDKAYVDLQAEVHPDRFAAADDSARRLAMQWSTRVNEAYQTLKKPLARAKYLLHLAGHDVADENNTLMPADFLIEQLEWREAVAEARAVGDHHELEHMHHRLQRELSGRYDELGDLFDERCDFVEAADRVRRLMFIEKLLVDLDEALAACDE
ncbi:MAG: Fe-S protein assembly co-chaperone HscB [Candidatus Accumulibacter sp.]|uniref:Fe-S protein assembly co-chaperone HscB n=1 Tax=Accumulibacter sp. TaxID=2053492 RepID=UPI00287892C3|nr:Fe-S protein assembly co-chaperone HscB [Accumulibacter sp.]MDS4013336.1 Fe-S protein assembly co-chaperone HscB [Accumulibacter sp.]